MKYILVRLGTSQVSKLESELGFLLSILDVMRSRPLEARSPREIKAFMRRDGDSIYLLWELQGTWVQRSWLEIGNSLISNHVRAPGSLFDLLRRHCAEAKVVSEGGSNPWGKAA